MASSSLPAEEPQPPVIRVLLDTNVVLDWLLVVMACAAAERLDYVIIRNPDDFRQSPIKALMPLELAQRL